MRIIAIVFGILTYSEIASAQWAVLDQSVLDMVEKINNTSSGSANALTHFADQALLDADFKTIPLANPEKYIGTTADCGDEKLNANHYNACIGLRNLRIKTLEQTFDILKNINDRRESIKTVVNNGSGTSNAGALQKQQFILQGIQANLQNDSTQLQALHFGYKQREAMFEMQMAEARRATDTRAAPGPAGLSITLPVKFPR
ncbi:hypothetical protein LPB72_10525 [Hydrogenophaga crassostreae]|uniref:Type VI secretion protein n=1 Tax=Hydrogenophaga crassostreae TaxID=1763535 RepID=A0A167HU61_9BURK|nr:hypothetical protein [Hydrogenophaga crassostreae]AOW13452.1 hypothetical protein LPB072_11905 [Hydrogenophaga crassostreae]OAD41742.1 hypothetical protein LPB72_10525 [Hydrogenophaga crassostreae]